MSLYNITVLLLSFKSAFLNLRLYRPVRLKYYKKHRPIYYLLL